MRTRTWLALWLVFFGSTGRAADLWVKNGGSDSADGLSPATAWATLGHAAGVVNPGDTVHVLDGSYQGFDLRRSGTAGSPVTFNAEGSNVRITADNGTTTDGINVENADHVVIDGFIVDGRTRAGIRVAVSQFVTVENCHAGNNGRWGIFSGFADDLTIENNEAHHSQAEHGIYVSNSGDRPVIRRNVVHDNHANGIHMNGDLGQGGDGLISGALVERNVIYGNGVGGGSGINMDGVTDSVVQNNLLYDNHASGVSLYRIDGATGSKRNVVVNNTIVNAADARWCVNINNGSTDNTVLNNILYTYHSFRGAVTVDSSSRPGLTSDYNAVISRFSTDAGNTVIDLAAWQALGYDAHSFVATPAELFVAPGSDFHLLATSPRSTTGRRAARRRSISMAARGRSVAGSTSVPTRRSSRRAATGPPTRASSAASPASRAPTRAGAAANASARSTRRSAATDACAARSSARRTPIARPAPSARAVSASTRPSARAASTSAGRRSRSARAPSACGSRVRRSSRNRGRASIRPYTACASSSMRRAAVVGSTSPCPAARAGARALTGSGGPSSILPAATPASPGSRSRTARSGRMAFSTGPSRDEAPRASCCPTCVACGRRSSSATPASVPRSRGTRRVRRGRAAPATRAASPAGSVGGTGGAC